MKIIDCSANIGLDSINRVIVNHEDYPVYERIKQLPHAEDLINEMDFCGIEKAFVYHQAMYDTDPQYGNKLILKEVSAYPDRLCGTWTILPPITESFFEPKNLIPEMKKSKILALRAFPQRNRYFLDEVTMGELLDTLCQCHIPLYLTPINNWEHIFAVLKEFPELTVIITNYGLWGSDRYFYPLVRKYKNVYIDTSDYQVINGYRAFVQKFGSERLLFGTNMPMDNIGGPIATLFGSGITTSDIENVAFKNIEALMGRVKL